MNFMAKSSSSQGGFNGEDRQKQLMSSTSPRGKLPFSSSSTSSSSSSSSQQQQHRKNLLPPTFHHYHHQQQHNITSWLEHPHQTLLTEEISGGGGGIRCYNGVPTQLDLMDASPSAGAGAGNDDNNDVRGGDSSSDGLGLGVGNNSGNNNTPASTVGVVEREHMFDKVVTPSDVGKLNRLVIPKQHAEKYFPLDSSTNEKGLLLNFEDRNGKPWRFRYSYWNSSQSYVMTKGWSRFVKEKKLDAGDVVSFQRGVGELGKDRLFIDWRRRPDHATDNLPPSHHHHPPPHNYFSFHRPTTQFSWSPLFLQHQQQQQQPPPQEASRDHYSNFQQLNYQPHSTNYGYGYGYSAAAAAAAGGPYYSYNNNNNTSLMNPCSSSLVYVRSGAAATHPPQYQQGAAGMVQLQSSGGSGGGGGGGSGGSMMPSMVYESVPVVQGKAAAKRLRLFGVNMDCPISESDECDILSSSTTILPQYPTIPPHLSSSPIPPLQLRLYNGTPLPAMQHLHHKTTQHQGTNNNNKSFDLDI